MIIHKCKLSKEYFDAVKKVKKILSYEKMTEKYKTKHILHLREYDLAKEEYTGRHISRVITYVLKNSKGLQDDYVILEIEKKGVRGERK